MFWVIRLWVICICQGLLEVQKHSGGIGALGPMPARLGAWTLLCWGFLRTLSVWVSLIIIQQSEALPLGSFADSAELVMFDRVPALRHFVVFFRGTGAHADDESVAGARPSGCLGPNSSRLFRV